MTPTIPLENLTKRYSRYFVYIEPVVSDPLVRGYFSLVSSLLLIAFLAIFALSPTINVIISLQKKIGEEQKLVEAMKEKISNLAAAQQNYSQAENLLPVLYNALPEQPEPAVIISAVVNSASESGVTINSLQFRDIPLSTDSGAIVNPPEGTPERVAVVSFSLSMAGDFQSMRKFLANLESLSRIIKTVDLSVATSVPSASGNSFRINAVAYYLPPPI